MHEKTIDIRWRDLDAYGHVNQAVYLTYAEEVLDEWFRQKLGRDPGAQAVLFYCWTSDVEEVRVRLAAAGVGVGEISCPFYMPAGEIRVADPDGYVLLVGQLDRDG